jgi:hypothetical protein
MGVDGTLDMFQLLRRASVLLVFPARASLANAAPAPPAWRCTGPPDD